MEFLRVYGRVIGLLRAERKLAITLAFANVAVTCRRIGDSHLKLSVSDGGGPALDCIAFGAFDGPLGPCLETGGHQRFHLAGKLELNHWNGRTRVQLRLDDAALA